jgi:molybdenum cofactor cytidylyltransferase
MPETESCALMVLAAGGSRRMGSAKQLLHVNGEPLVRLAARIALEANLHPVVVVLGAQADRIRPQLAGLALLMVENPGWREGLASSLRAGIDAILRAAPSARGLIVMPVDQPRLTSAHLKNIEAAQRASGSTIVASDYGDHRGPPAYFGRLHFPELLALRGDKGARELLCGGNVQLIAAPPGSGFDLDRPEDHDRLRDA